MYNEMLGKWHFWITFLGTYAIYYPMHYLGFEGVPRRYFAYGDTAFMSDSVQDVNVAITIAAIVVALGQILIFYNLARSLFVGKPSGPNPWHATTLEWQTEHTPPQHGNFGKELPIVYRWAYDYGVPGAVEDYIPQNVPPQGTPIAHDAERHPEIDPNADPAEEEHGKP
jgi:cytochrome c oxidase subunit 1